MSKLKLRAQFFKRTTVQRLYNLDCALIGLTGSIGTGKSTAAKILKNLGHPVIDADKLVKDIYKNESSISFIKNIDQSLINLEGNVNFKLLRETFFNDQEIKLKVEAFIYAKIETQFRIELESLSISNYVFYDIPLLFEKKMQSLFDMTICIHSTINQQIQRITQRDMIDEKFARQMIESQIPISEKVKLCDFPISNEETSEKLNEKLIELSQNMFINT